MLCATAGVFNGVMDEMQFRSPWYRKYDWFNPLKSWMYKWENSGGVRVVCLKAPWYYLFIYKPQYQEKFMYSSTLLVFTTDAWHFCKSMVFTCYEVSGDWILPYV